eukprot:COSAG01_NODE_3189_length_6441_cov_8.086566_8_plen_83_part_00
MAVTDAAVSQFKYGDEHKRKPGCPRRGDMPVHGLTTSKNFITANAIENILAGPWLSEPAGQPARPPPASCARAAVLCGPLST